jgi:NADPH:quinone reductase-like Zn-dependent oxidoreductase
MIVAGSEDLDSDRSLGSVKNLAARLKLSWTKRTRKGFFLRAEDYFGYARRLARIREGLIQDLRAVEEEFKGRSKTALGLATGLRNLPAALVVSVQNFKDPNVRLMVLVTTLTGILVLVPAANVLPVPTLDPPLSWAEAAAFSLVTLTAWRMVVTRARLQSGETLLAWGVGGGVSLTAMRIARLRGARTIVTSSSDEKLAAARALGADVTINHRTHKVAAEIRALTAKRGVDVVIENVGEATWEESLRCLAKGGRLVTCGATSGPRVSMDIRRLFWNQYTIMGSTMGNAAEYAEIVRVLGTGALRPIVDGVYPLAEARAAFERMERGEQMGKIVVSVTEDGSQVVARS